MQEIGNLDQLTEQQLLDLLPEPKAPNIISYWDIALLVGSFIVLLIVFVFIIWLMNRTIKKRRQQQQVTLTSQLAFNKWQQLSDETINCQQRITKANELIRAGLPKSQQTMYGANYAKLLKTFSPAIKEETLQALTTGLYQRDFQLAKPKQFHQQIGQLLIELPWNT